MITDIFSCRYEGVALRDQYVEEDRRFMNQAVVMIMNPLWGQGGDKPSDFTETNLKDVHDVLALELGVQFLADRYWFGERTWNGNTIPQTHTYTYADMCKYFLLRMPPDIQNAGSYIKDRISLVEIAFRRRWQEFQEEAKALPAKIAEAEESDRVSSSPKRWVVTGSRAHGVRASYQNRFDAFAALARDLNDRLRLAKYPLTFHNGMIQFSADETVTAQVAKPFWGLVAGPEWANVDEQIKEAIDRRDRRDRTAAFHAVCALESAIKIISSKKGWTNGNEKGAANYVDNLVSKSNGRFIETWESEMLKEMFSNARNPFAHGPGQDPMPKFSDEQTNWAIDIAMSWIKSLIRRL